MPVSADDHISHGFKLMWWMQPDFYNITPFNLIGSDEGNSTKFS